ncbi:MAG: ribonuclease P protein component [Actinomycetes bacterium]
MLAAQYRLRDRKRLNDTVRRGRRAGRRDLVVHYLAPDSSRESTSAAGGQQPPGVAFAVSRAVGGSVVRHRVTRRLRHVMMSHIQQLPPGSSVMVRALPPAADASSADLDRELSALIRRVVG